MTTLYEGVVGDADLIYPPDGLRVGTVQLLSPARKVKALLRGFELGFTEGDRELKSLSIELETGYGDDENEVIVTARTRLAAAAGNWSATRMLVYYTLVAEGND
jgi:hypothetical protein